MKGSQPDQLGSDNDGAREERKKNKKRTVKKKAEESLLLCRRADPFSLSTCTGRIYMYL